ncbi:glycosyltransferase family 4 protein [Novosphingobium aquimarinum]|uniref:glycosyltransferase family 4 protein n=1 Tax=Novosphingobium aquimarinum TaxID=2682494 RepID=UPI0012EB6FDE|nr:glycosyltransferase family 4 protein [Novosphingobium aquimarinum]
MKLAIIVTEFPKATETFIYRDLTAFKQAGCQLELHHIAPFRSTQKLHGFARHLVDNAHYMPFASVAAFAALLAALVQQPVLLAKTVWQIAWQYRRHPWILMKSLAVLPKALQFARHCRAAGIDHVHAEFAGHPATMAWIAHRFGGQDYSVSCRAHDIFRTQALLEQKLGEASAVRTVSNFGRIFLRQTLSNGPALDIEVIHSSVDTAAIRGGPVRIDPARPRLLYVGALEPKKGVGYLLDALGAIDAQFGDWHLTVIGDGPSRDALAQQAARLGIAARVEFRGALPFEDVAEAYRSAALCLCPSIIGPGGRMEGIPNVVIEALAYRRPVVSTDISGIPELVTHGEHGLLVPQRDAAALGSAILQVFAQPAAAAAMAERGRARVEDDFDLGRNAARQLAMFRGEQAHFGAKVVAA